MGTTYCDRNRCHAGKGKFNEIFVENAEKQNFLWSFTGRSSRNILFIVIPGWSDRCFCRHFTSQHWVLADVTQFFRTSCRVTLALVFTVVTLELLRQSRQFANINLVAATYICMLSFIARDTTDQSSSLGSFCETQSLYHSECFRQDRKESCETGVCAFGPPRCTCKCRASPAPLIEIVFKRG